MFKEMSQQLYRSLPLQNFRVTIKDHIYSRTSQGHCYFSYKYFRSISTTTQRRIPLSFNNNPNSKTLDNDSSIKHDKQILTNNYSPVDSTHFFTNPNREEPSSKINKFSFLPNANNTDNVSEMNIGEAIKQYQDRKRRFTIWFTLTTLLSLLIGYKIIYKVVYLKRDSYIPLFPCNKIHRLTPKEEQKLNINNVKDLVYTKLMGKLTSHDFIKDHYGIPLRIMSSPNDRASNNYNDKENNNINNKFQKFDIWCEDEDLIIFGILFKPNDNIRIDYNNKKWHLVPGLFKWKFSHQSVNIMERIQDILDFIGLKYDKMITPEVTYDTFKYEVPIHFNNNEDLNIYDSLNNDHHAMHICFNGELNIDDKSSVRFEGKYHVDVKFEEISLTRREDDGNLVKYILYNNNEK